MSLTIQLLNKTHEKKNFDCGETLLDNYLKKRARQDVSRDLSACFVLAGDQDNLVLGYYTLSSNSIRRDSFPEEISRKLPPSYDELPTILLGRLAIDRKIQGKRYGEILLFDALKRCAELSHNLGSLAVAVDPINEKAELFYGSYGFILLPGSKKMFIPVKTIEELIC